MVLPGASVADLGNAGTYALQEAQHSRDYLTRFLTPIIGNEAEEIAARLTDEFGTLSDLLAAHDIRLRLLCGPHQKAFEQLILFREMMRHALKFQISRGPIFSHAHCLRDYLVERLAFLTHEVALGLFLDSRNALIRDVVLCEGTLAQAPVFPREIAKRALTLGAASLILVHNHPSGEYEASGPDIRITRQIVEACRTIDVLVHDHIIVARSGMTSMHAKGLM